MVLLDNPGISKCLNTLFLLLPVMIHNWCWGLDVDLIVCVPVLLFTYEVALKPFIQKQGKRKVQGVPQSQTAALPRHQEEEETDKTKQAQIEQTYKKH